jgi:hypothetical protein
MPTATKGRRIPAQAAPESVDDRRRVHGVLVIADEDVPSPLSSSGKPVTFKGLRLLTLEGGKQIYGCADCDHTGTRGQVAKHRGEKHGAKLARPNRGRAPSALPDEVSNISIAELLEIARGAPRWEEMFEEERARTADWRQRCQVAEARVRQINAALERIGFVERVDD